MLAANKLTIFWFRSEKSGKYFAICPDSVQGGAGDTMEEAMGEMGKHIDKAMAKCQLLKEVADAEV